MHFVTTGYFEQQTVTPAEPVVIHMAKSGPVSVAVAPAARVTVYYTVADPDAADAIWITLLDNVDANTGADRLAFTAGIKIVAAGGDCIVQVAQ